MKNTDIISSFNSVYRQLLVIIIIICPLRGMSQILLNEQAKTDLERSEWIESQVNQKLNLESNNLKLASISMLVLDSIEETAKTGFYIENYKWYFKYNNNKQLISSEKHLSGVQGNPADNYYEYRTYNENNKLTGLIKQETIERGDFPDTLITRYSENNTYTSENLTEQSIYFLRYFYIVPETGSMVISSFDSYTNYYEYNDKNQLIFGHEYYPYSTDGDGFRELSCYYDNDLLKYKYYHLIHPALYKYDYQTIGDVYIKMEKLNSFLYDNNTDIFDTISNWPIIHYDTISFDALGRVKTLKNSEYAYYNNTPTKIKYKFKAEFEYNSYNQITHARYYHYANEDDGSSYVESTRIDNTYDSEGNILEHHHTIYDAQYRRWETYNKKTYYYSSYIHTAIPVENELTELSIYPNPANSVLHLSNPYSLTGTYSIISMTGVMVEKEKTISETIDVSALAKGVYIILFKNELKTQTLKFVKN